LVRSRWVRCPDRKTRRVEIDRARPTRSLVTYVILA
jgi:hypothetical protein